MGAAGYGTGDFRLRPDMASARLLLLKFIGDYYGIWGQSPSYGEMVAGTGLDRSRIQKAVKSLVRDGLLLRTPGPRGLALPAEEIKARQLLTALGYVVVNGDTNYPLLAIPALDYTEGHERGKEQGHKP